ncbi:MAG: hypothetical protein IJU36_01490 [Paludibacteraceae bacterium]|nr:hypothetical protein [Paludibacteraceae bacterium]
MRLSVNNINQVSPYWVIQLDDLTFRFITKNGIVYRVGFRQDPYFLGERAYHFFISNDSEITAPKDVDVFKVITCVLEEFFSQDSSVMLYICDPYDHRENVRDNLYKRWFNNYPRHNELTLQAEELNFDGYIVYTGMILRNDNPDYKNLLDTYKAFVKRANSIYNIQPK